MTKQVQIRRGTTAQHEVFTGALAELTYDTDKKTVFVHDGTTQGGIGLARSDFSNVSEADLNLTGNLSVTGITTLGSNNGIGTVTVGIGTTALYVDGPARVTGYLSVGSSSIIIDGDSKTINIGPVVIDEQGFTNTETGGVVTTDTLAAAIASLDVVSARNLTLTGIGTTTYELNATIQGTVASGSTIFPLSDVTLVSVGDLIGVSTFFSNIAINQVGYGTAVEAWNKNVYNTTVSAIVAAGSSNIGLANTSSISIGSSLSIAGIITYAPIVGFSTVAVPTNNDKTATVVSITAGVNTTIIPIDDTSLVSIGNSLSSSVGGTRDGRINYIPIVGVTSIIVSQSNTALVNVSAAATVSLGSTIVPVTSISGVSIGNSFSVTGAFTNARITAFGSQAVDPFYFSTGNTTIAELVPSGSTVIYVDSIVGVDTGNYIEVTAGAGTTNEGSIVLAKTQITGYGATTVTVAAGIGVSLFASDGVTYYDYIATADTIIANVGAADTFIRQSVVAISTLTNNYNPAVEVFSGITTTLTAGDQVIISEVLQVAGPSVLISSGSTVNQQINPGTTVSISTVTTFADYVTVGLSSITGIGTVPIGEAVNIKRIQEDDSTLSVNTLYSNDTLVQDLHVPSYGRAKFSGITTIGVLTFPSGDGIKGQVLTTDGDGNIGFATGGGSGSKVVVRVSQQAGDDANDGRTQPVQSIKKGCQIASFLGYFFNTGATVLVDSGDYVEDNPLILYDNVNIVAESLRNVVVRPLNAGKDLFKVRNGNYITGLTLTDYVDPINKIPQHTFDYSVAFDDPFDTSYSRAGYAATATVGIVSAIYDNAITGICTVVTSSDHELYPGNSVRLTGLGWTCGYDETGISSIRYNEVVGISTLTLRSAPNRTDNGGSYTIGDELFLHNFQFACAAEHAGVTTTIFPYAGLGTYGAVYPIIGVNTAAKTITVQGGITTIPHIYIGWQKLGISTFQYTESTGVCTGVTREDHGYQVNDKITLRDLPFSCAVAHAGVTTTLFPDGTINSYNVDGYTFTITGVTTNSFTFNAGISTIAHIYDGFGSVGISTFEYTYQTGFSTALTSSPHGLSVGDYVTLDSLQFTCNGYSTGPTVNITAADYNEVVGIITITTDSAHGLDPDSTVQLGGLEFSCAAEHAGISTTIFPTPLHNSNAIYGYDVFRCTTGTTGNTIVINCGVSTIAHTYVSGGTATAGVTTSIFPDGSGPYGYTFRVTDVADTTTFTVNAGVTTIAHAYLGGGTAKKVPVVEKVPTIQTVKYYPDDHQDGRIDFQVVSAVATNEFTFRGNLIPSIRHYYTKGGTARLSRPVINKSPYIQNCSILSSLGGNGILVDGDKVVPFNIPGVQLLAENPVVGSTPEFGKSMVAATFTMISFDGIGWRTINDGYAQVVSCFQIFCRYGSLSQSGGYLSITNSATNFGNIALRATGFSPNSFVFDRGRVADTGTSGGLQTLRVIGVGRSDQDLYVLRFFADNGTDSTNLFKPLVTESTFNPSTAVDIDTEIITISGHPFADGDSVVYLGNERANPPIVIDGLVNGNIYYVQYINATQFKLFEDESFRKPVDLTTAPVGVNTFQKNNQEFVVNEIIDSHQAYQSVILAGVGSTAVFNSGQEVTQSVTGGVAVGYALTFNPTSRSLIVSVEEVGGVRRYFSADGGSGTITDHSANLIGVAVTAVSGISSYYTINFKVDSTVPGNVIQGIGSLPIAYRCHLHRPSIVNSSSHTWEFSGSGTDYNALPQNGGTGDVTTEQVSELGGRVYASGTNELGDFKIGSQITAYNRTGNIVFNNKVSIGELDSIRLTLSGGVAVEEFSTDTNLGDTELGGPQNKRVSTQLAVRSFLSNRLGTFIDKTVSTNAIPGAVVQLNSAGQINADLIPPQVVTYTRTNVGAGRTVLVNQIPAKDIKQGDTVVEPENAYVLVNDVVSQYLILDTPARDYNFVNGQEVTSALTGTAIGIVTTPPEGVGIGTTIKPYVGYGSTGLVKGVMLNTTLTNAGSGYNSAGIYTGVPVTTVSGVGAGATATVTVNASGNVSQFTLITGGKGYANGDIVNVANGLIGGRTGGADFQATVGDVETRLYLTLTNNSKFVGTADLPDYVEDGDAVGLSTELSSQVLAEFDPTDILTAGSIDFANSRVVIGANTFSDGDPVKYSAQGGTPVTGLINNNTYYIKRVGVTSVELHPTYAIASKINITGSGIGTHALIRDAVSWAKDTVVFVGHGFQTADPVRVSGVVPPGITTGGYYFVGSATTNSFTLHNTQTDAAFSANGVTFNQVAITTTTSGICTFTKQNVRYAATVNTSSTDPDNWSLLAQQDIDAANIISGIVAPSRLGSGSANSDTVLTGISAYRKAVFSVGIGTTQPMGATGSSVDFAPGGVGLNTYYGNVNLTLNRVQSTLDLYSTLGVSKFKTSTFEIGTDGAVSLKNSLTGDVDASTLGANNAAYYLNSANHTGTIPINRGGTGQTGLPASGAILIGNGSAYNLTTSPTFVSDVTINGTLNVRTAIDLADSDILRLGSSDDWELFHNGTDNYMDLNVGNLFIRDNTTTRWTFTRTSGNFTATGTVTANSDIRLKSNVETITGALGMVNALRGVSYNRIDLEGEPRQIGVVAQEIEEVIPEVVVTGIDGIKSVAYQNIVAVLIEAIKEQNKSIEDLKKQVEELKKMMG